MSRRKSGVALMLVVGGVICILFSVPAQSSPEVIDSFRVINSMCYDEYYDYIAAATPEGLFLYHLVENYPVPTPENSVFDDYDVKKIVHLEKSSNIFALVGNDEPVVAKYNFNTKNWSKVGIELPLGVSIMDIEVGPNEEMIYLATNAGLLLHNSTSNSNEFLNINHGLLSNHTCKLLWVSGWLIVGLLEGFSIMDTDTKTFQNEPMYYNYGRSVLAADCIMSLEDLSRVYVGTKRGLRVFSFMNRKIAIVPVRNPTPDPLPSLEIQCLALDTTRGTLFVGTENGPCWYDTDNDDWGGLLKGRMSPDNHNVSCMVLLSGITPMKLFIGSSNGLVSIDGASRDPGRSMGQLLLDLINENQTTISFWFSLFALAISFVKWSELQNKDTSEQQLKEAKKKAKEARKRGEDNLKTSLCSHMQTIQDALEAKAFPVDSGNLLAELSSEKERIDSNWFALISEVVQKTRKLNILVEKGGGAEADILVNELSKAIQKVRAQGDCK